MLRILLFAATNIAIMVLLSVVFKLLGLDGILQQNGVDLNLSSLLVYSAVIGFSGSIISLLLSKRMAKSSMRVKVITQPSDSYEEWMMQTVSRQARQADISMPEVGIFDHPSPNAFATGWNKNKALVAISTGLMRSMPKEEVEAVLAHEISHVANGDMVTLTPRPRPRVLYRVHGCTGRARLFSDRSREVVFTLERVPCRRWWRPVIKSPEDDCRPEALEARP